MDSNTQLWVSQFFMISAVHVLAVVAPGPDFAVIVSQSVRHGRHIGRITALGIGCGIAIHVVYTLLGVGLLLLSDPELMRVAKWIGAIYLLWMSWQFLRAQPSMAQDDPEVKAHSPSAHKAFWRGFFTNATNPKATLFFLMIFTTVVSASTPMRIQALYGLWLCLITTLWFVLVATWFSNDRVRTLFFRIGHWFERVMGMLLLVFALRLLRDQF